MNGSHQGILGRLVQIVALVTMLIAPGLAAQANELGRPHTFRAHHNHYGRHGRHVHHHPRRHRHHRR